MVCRDIYCTDLGVPAPTPLPYPRKGLRTQIRAVTEQITL